MDLSGPDNCAQDMVQQRDEDPTPPPAVPVQAKRWCRKEPVVSLTHSPLKGLNVVLSRVDTAAPSESSLVSSKQDTKMGQDEGTAPSHPDGGDKASIGEGFPAPPSGTVHGGSAEGQTPPPESVSLPVGNGPAADAFLTPPAKVPKKRGRKSKAELLAMAMAKKLEEESRGVVPEPEPEKVEVTPGGRPRRRAAAVALRYLHDLAEELSVPGRTSPSVPDNSAPEQKTSPEKTPKPPQSGKKGRKRKSRDSDDGDSDFVVSEDLLREEEVEDDCLSDEAESDLRSYNMNVFAFGEKPYPQMKGVAENGFHNSIMTPIYKSAEITMDFRNAYHSDWEFPDWIPRKDNWNFLSCQTNVIVFFCFPTDTSELTICKVDPVVRLYVGSIKSCRSGDNGQCFLVAWHHKKPHQYLAAGFYDGTVSIWDLYTKSILQKVRQGSAIKQYPFLSFSAHNHAVRCVEWCKADSNFIVTCGVDRNLKFWDLRRLAAPLNDFKRFQGTEVTWLLPYCGVVLAQDNCFAAFGLCGLHYVDAGFMGYKPYFAAPRRGTVWSVSGSDWLGTVTAGDITGEVMAVMMPFLNVHSINTKRPADRRFPIYKADFQSSAPPPDSDTQSPSGEPLTETTDYQRFKPKSFRAAASRARLLFQDTDLRDFHRINSREPTRRMITNETKGEVNMERVQLESIHKVRFSPNLDTYTWIVSAGHSGLVRVHCIRGLVSSAGQGMIQEKTAQFQATNRTCESDCNPEVLL
ncbi:LOW QUALITY PROTEIN: general transcription factor 3C polypeptide 2 [Lithobates pipiens]